MSRILSIRTMKSSRGWGLTAAASLALAAGVVSAEEAFIYADRPIHPACIQALVMQHGDSTPVTTAVSLEGCASSARSKSEMHNERDLVVIKDETLPGGGTFGYRVINQLTNGIFGLAIIRVLPGGEEEISLAAVQLVVRPMIRHEDTVHLMLVELLGELWIPDVELSSFESIGNKVHFISGKGVDRVERTVDFTSIGKQRK